MHHTGIYRMRRSIYKVLRVNSALGSLEFRVPFVRMVFR